MTNLQLEARLRRAAGTYRRMAPVIPDLEPRILAQVAVTPRAPSRQRFGGRSLVIQLAATAALLIFAIGVAFLIRESRLLQQLLPVTTPIPSASPSPPKSAGGGGSYKYSVFGMGMWHPGGMMVTPSIGWSGGTLLSRTTDGRAHWTIVTPSDLRNPNDTLITEYLDATHAWIVQDLGDRTNVLRTTDGGRTWHQGAPIMHRGGSTIQIDFVDPAHGWLLTEASGYQAPFTVYRTTDGGAHWQLTSVSTTKATAMSGTFGCAQWCLVSFASPTAGSITSLNAVDTDSGMSLLITHDGGVTWTRVSVPLSASQAQCPCFVDRPVFLDAAHGFLVVWSAAGPIGVPIIGHLFVSADAGNTWSARALPGEAESDIGFSDPLHGWAIAASVADISSLDFAAGPELPLPLYRTEDGGMTWVRVSNALKLRSTNGEIRRINFLDQNVGFVFSVQTGRPQVLKTVDGGRTWIPTEGTPPPAPVGG